jgi:LAO/AO transport system kinase
VPESGDGIQTLKAGVMEIADVYVVNKSDRPGGDKLRQEVEVMLGIRRGNAFRHVRAHHTPAVGRSGGQANVTHRPSADRPEWEEPVLGTVASRGEGIEELVSALDRHYAYLQQSGKLAERRRRRLAQRTRAVLDRAVQQWISQSTQAEELLARRLDDVVEGRKSPYDVVAEILDQVKDHVKAGTPR